VDQFDKRELIMTLRELNKRDFLVQWIIQMKLIHILLKSWKRQLLLTN